MQKLKLTFFFIFIHITLLLNAQNGDSIQIGSPKKNSSYFELFGNGSIYSINFERLFFSKPSWQLRGHIGYCLWNYYEADRFFSFKNIFPMEISFIKGKNEHHLECGAGYTFIFNVNDTYFSYKSLDIQLKPEMIDKTGFLIKTHPFISLRVGYRYERPDGKGVLFRIAPLIKYRENIIKGSVKNKLGIAIGISLGKAF